MRPQRIVVIGAGIVGLSCALSLQDYDVEVEVLDRGPVGGGASWGNAGYLAPSCTVPLPEPAMLRYGLRAVFDRRSPVRLPIRPDAELARFLFHFARHCTGERWSRAMAGYRLLNARIFESFDAQREAGVEVPVHEADILAAFSAAGKSAGLLQELDGVAASGQPVEVGMLTGEQARAAEPNLSERIVLALRIGGQRYLDPVAYVAALTDLVRVRGGKITEHVSVSQVERRAGRTVLRCADGQRDADAAILANGAWLPELAIAHGVRMPQSGGRGYSFSLRLRQPLRGPVYLPSVRAAITPRGDRARVAGAMEFQRPDAPLDPARIDATICAARPLLDGADWEDTTEHWVGARPLTADGVPLVGPSKTEGVYVAGGHGMWGVTLGPLTGRLLADHIITGAASPELDWLNPLR
jgi:D-amino-acid dehydrogenase